MPPKEKVNTIASVSGIFGLSVITKILCVSRKNVNENALFIIVVLQRSYSVSSVEL